MGNDTTHQRKAFEFLKEKFESQELFTTAEFQKHTGFDNDNTFRTYMSKHFKGLLLPAGKDAYRVSAVFRQFSTWSKFVDKVVSQNRNFGRKYENEILDAVIIFEFYMPLRNEEYLRQTLDSLFYSDSITFRLNLLTPIELEGYFKREEAEAQAAYLKRVTKEISGMFGGYSIQHVNGRFRAGQLMSRAEARSAERYLVDETTAVVRFILPCRPSVDQTVDQAAELIRWVFTELFVKTILEVVNAEDEIWLLESGMRHRLHIWRAQD